MSASESGELMSGSKFAKMLEDTFLEDVTQYVQKKIEGVKTLPEAAALCDVTLHFAPLKTDQMMNYGFSAEGKAMLQIDPSLREKDQWEQLVFGLSLIYLRRQMPELFGLPIDT